MDENQGAQALEKGFIHRVKLQYFRPQVDAKACESPPALVFLRTMTQEQMVQRLQAAYPGSPIEVVDLTGTENHWQVYVQSELFKGLSRIQQHQHVMAAFGPELKTGEVHALSIKTEVKN